MMVALGTVVYASAFCYLDDFIDSINNQTCKVFDVIIINDNVDSDVLYEKIKKIIIRNVYIIDMSHLQKTPAELRVNLLLEAKERGYDLLIMADCDDTFSKSRVENIRNYYTKYPDYAFYYNDILLLNNKFAIFSMPQETLSILNILECNYLGLSNNAINLRKISKRWLHSLEEFDGFVFDWYLFSRILLKNECGLYIENAATFYRIHQNNFAGLKRINDKSALEKEINVKKCHYRNLAKYSPIMDKLYKIYRELEFDDVYQSNDSSNYWWSNIKFFSEEN